MSPHSDLGPAPSATDTRLAWLAAASLVVAGLAFATYALVGFTSPDWTIFGPRVAVAVAGVVGLRVRWLHFAGLAPMGAVLTVAGPVLAFDLARPGEWPYFIGTVVGIVSCALAAVLGPASALGSRRPRLSLVFGTAIVLVPVVFVLVILRSPASAVPANTTAAERSTGVEVQVVDFAFTVDPAQLQQGAVIHLRNNGTLPHDFTIPSLDLAVFVPAGRDTYVQLPETPVDDSELICTIGDHADRGMRLDITAQDP